MDDLEADFGNTFIPILKYNWVQQRVALIEQLYNTKEKTHFTLVGLRHNGFIAKTQGLDTYVLFSKMPWSYNSIESWEAVSAYLYGELFYCEIDKLSINPFFFTINGNVPQFENVELKKDIEYDGIIIKKEATYLLIDIGYHLKWYCGSIVGVLSRTNFNFSYHNPDFNPGKTIKVKFNTILENGHIGLKKDLDKNFWLNLNVKKLVGLIVEVRYFKTVDRYDEFWVKDRYKGFLLFNYEVYGCNLDEVIELKNNLENNDVIQCEILSINTVIGYFNLKWNAPTKFYKLWHSEEINQLIGAKVSAKLIDKENQLIFLINNLYHAVLPLSAKLYPDNIRTITKLYYDLNINDVINCEIFYVNKEKGFFSVKWLLETENEINWELLDISEFKNKTLKAKIIKTDDNIEFLIDDKYNGIITINKIFYGNDHYAVLEYLDQMNDGEYIDCEVIYIDETNKFMKFRWINYKDKIFWTSDSIKHFIDQTTWVRVVKKEGCEIEFFVKDIYKAIMPLSNDIYTDNFEKIKFEYNKLQDLALIQCKILSINIRGEYLVIKWMLPNKKRDYWYLEEIDNMVGKYYEAELIKEGVYNTFKINNKYKAILSITKEIYPDDSELVLQYYKDLKEGEIIYCKIIGVEKDMGYFKIEWIYEIKK